MNDLSIYSLLYFLFEEENILNPPNIDAADDENNPENDDIELE